MKKNIAWLLLCCGLITLATSCGGKKAPSAPNSAPQPAGE
jgi:hypothetical protein